MNMKSMKEYRVWRAMKARCYAPSQTKGYYKQNHITVCDRWRNSFNAFIEDMGRMPDESYSIERIDVLKGYEPDNCKWIPQREQPKNRNNTLWIAFNGEYMCLRDVAKKTGIKYTTLYQRYRRAGNDLKAVDVAIREYYGMNTKEDN